MVLPINFQRSPVDFNIMYGMFGLIAGGKNNSVKAEFIDLPCEKLEGIAHIKAGYYFGKNSRFLAGFECKQAEDCGIGRSPFSNTLNYSVHCPIYIALANKFEWKLPSEYDLYFLTLILSGLDIFIYYGTFKTHKSSQK